MEQIYFSSTVILQHVRKKVRVGWISIPYLIKTILLLTIISVSLTGCGGGKQSELRKYIDKTLQRPGGKIEPIPTIEPFVPYHYSSSALRSPFLLPKKISATSSYQPDVNRPKEELEAFPLDSLKMVGTLGQGSNMWALIAAPNGGVYKVGVGGYLGKNYGRIQKIESEQLTILETLPDGQGGWTQKTATVTLTSAPADTTSSKGGKTSKGKTQKKSDTTSKAKAKPKAKK